MLDTLSGGAGRQFVTFTSNGLGYGLDVEVVREIRGWTPETPLPGNAPHVRGVLNLRGAVVPILDVGQLFGRPKCQPSAQHVVVIVASGDALFGLLVDAVDDIVTITPDAVQPVPNDEGLGGGFVTGIITHKDQLVALLDCGLMLRRDRAA